VKMARYFFDVGRSIRECTSKGDFAANALRYHEINMPRESKRLPYSTFFSNDAPFDLHREGRRGYGDGSRRKGETHLEEVTAEKDQKDCLHRRDH